ncbi:MAG: RnfABCDGE type electron transport complex subunit D [Clostridia bacterium]|nr:RnfABCDGE type electron transport complex subunit D [Clostridia bacterium]
MSAEEKLLVVSPSPHVRSASTVTRIMFDVILACVPSLIAAVILFGYRVLAITAVSVGTCMLAEWVCRKVMKRRNTLGDLSAVVTGLLLAFNVPVTIKLWMVAFAGIVAIVVVKQFFGGIGMNFVNPALIGRIVLLASFPTAMSNWVQPLSWRTDVVTTASPLAEIGNLYKAGDVSKKAIYSIENMPSLVDMLLGKRSGSLGEVCALALLIGLAYLLIRKVIKPTIPFFYIGTVAVIMLIAGKFNLTFLAYELMAGGLLLGAIFMATDYTTSPVNFRGQIVYAVGCGLITALIRLFGSLPEGVSFAIIIMNILTPHIENLTSPKPFGSEKKKKGAAES